MANYDLTYEGSRVQGILDTGNSLKDAGYIFRGEATPSTVPGTPTERVAYIGGPGTYTNFGSSITVDAGCICVFKYTGSAWSNQVINTGLDSAVNTLQSAITAINNNIGNGYVYAGVATPSTSPVTGKVFYIAVQAGTYTNFGNAVVTAGLNVIKYNGSAWSVDQAIAIDAEPTQGSANLVKSGGVLNSIIQNGPAFDLSAYNAQGGVLATYADLSAALTALNALPADFKKGGMSVKYVQSSDNKYVQFRYMLKYENTTAGNAAFVNTDNWAVCDDEVLVENPEYVYVIKGKNNRIAIAIEKDGNIFYGAGVPKQVKDYIQSKIAELSLDEYENIVTFLGNLINGDKTLQTLLNEKVDKEEGKSLIDENVADSESFLENPEFLSVEKDQNGRIVETIEKGSGKKTIYTDFEVKGNFQNEGIQQQINSAIEAKIGGLDTEALSSVEYVENPEYAEVSKDKNGRIYEGLTKDGVKQFEVPVSTKQLKVETLTISSEEIDKLLSGHLPDAGYAVKDNIKHRLSVDCLGSGGFTTITDACAAVENPSYNNQYEICVYPGVYNELFIHIPPYTHIHGIAPNSVIVTTKNWQGESTRPVFQYEYFSSKLSNMTIESYTGYCVHFDTELAGCSIVSENLHLRKMYASDEQHTEWSIIGGGAFQGGVLYVWNNCIFESADSRGSAACHTNGNAIYENLSLIFKDCKFVNCSARLGSVGGFGNVAAIFENCTFERGFGLKNFFSAIRNVDMPNTYLANECEWQVLGSSNRGMTIFMTNEGEGLQIISDNYTANEVITISGSAVDALFGTVKYQKGGTRVKASAMGIYRVMDEQTGRGTQYDRYQMWKRLGDCSVNNKTLSVSINGGTAMTYTFNQNYLSTKPSEVDIIADVNTALSGCSLSKYTPSTWDNINLIEKQFVTCRETNGILKGEWVRISGTRCDSSTTKEEVLGVAVSDANNGESLQVWTGDTYKVELLPNGHYGIDDNGQLVANSSIIIGKVINNILYKL